MLALAFMSCAIGVKLPDLGLRQRDEIGRRPGAALSPVSPVLHGGQDISAQRHVGGGYAGHERGDGLKRLEPLDEQLTVTE